MITLPRRGSLFWTLSGTFLGVLLLVLVGQGLVVLFVVEPATQRAQERRAEFVLDRVQPRIEDARAAGDLRRVAGLLRSAIDPGRPERLVMRTAEGEWYGGPGFGRQQSRHLEALWRGEEAPTPRSGRRHRESYRILTSRELEGGAVLCVLEPRRRLRVIEELPRQALLTLPIGFVLAAIAGLLLSHRIQRRLGRLEELAERVAAGDLTARVPEPAHDEIGQLGQRLNSMAAALERARDEVDAAAEQRRRLLADITHDLATPLTSIRGYAETLLDPAVPVDAPDRERYLRNVQHAAERMDSLVVDLLDLARLESGGAALAREELDLAALARHATAGFAPLFEKAGQTLTWDGGDFTAQVHADGRRLEQVMDNLLGNALRHLPSGSTTRVDVSRRDDVVVLTVADDGPGFAVDDLPRVFDRFHRGDPARSTPGSGLGLAIVREIARAHGGDAGAENDPKGGARLIVTIPAQRT